MNDSELGRRSRPARTVVRAVALAGLLGLPTTATAQEPDPPTLEERRTLLVAELESVDEAIANPPAGADASCPPLDLAGAQQTYRDSLGLPAACEARRTALRDHLQQLHLRIAAELGLENASLGTPPDSGLDRARWYQQRAEALQREAARLNEVPDNQTRCEPTANPDSEATTQALAQLPGECTGRKSAVTQRLLEYQAQELEARRSTADAVDSIIRWGTQEWRLTGAVALVSVSIQRRADEAARERRFEPSLEGTGGFSLLVLHRPCGMRRVIESGEACPEGAERKPTIQLVSFGLNLLFALPSSQGNTFPRLGLGLAMLFFDDAIGFTLGIDLYRGIDVLDTGRSTVAHTGLFSLFTPEGELTWENGYFGVLLNIEGLARQISGGGS